MFGVGFFFFAVCKILLVRRPFVSCGHGKCVPVLPQRVRHQACPNSSWQLDTGARSAAVVGLNVCLHK